MKIINLIAGFLGLSGVALGAFGAHALEDTLAARGHTATWETAVLYHLVHAVALFAATQSSVVTRHFNSVLAWCWGGGVLLFSGSLYVLCLGGPRWMGPITPLGGVLLIAGWAWVMRSAWRSRGTA